MEKNERSMIGSAIQISQYSSAFLPTVTAARGHAAVCVRETLFRRFVAQAAVGLGINYLGAGQVAQM